MPLAAPGMMAKGLRWMLDPASPFYVRPRISWDLMAWGWRFYRASTTARVRAAAPVLRDLSLRSRQLFEQLNSTDGFDFGLVQRGEEFPFVERAEQQVAPPFEDRIDYAGRDAHDARVIR